MPSGSRLDHVYRSILMTKFFTKGWGKPENLKRLFAFRKVVSNREACFKLVPRDYPISIVKEETYSDCQILEGKFISPFVTHLPGLLPKEAETAYFQVILPRTWNSEHYKPVCLHLAGTGDHGFWRRRQIMAKPLLKASGIGAILLENPFYGLRKPKDQIRSCLHNVTDIFVMGGCLILESLALFHWCERLGLGPLGITGMSMGGHMASLAATNWPKPIALVPCLSWSTASPVFTQGVMSGSINWDLLETQYFSDGIYRDEIKKMVIDEEICIPEQTHASEQHRSKAIVISYPLHPLPGNPDAFRAGQHFAKHYPESMDRINELNKEQHKDILITNAKSNANISSQTPASIKAGQKQNCRSASSHLRNTTEVSFMSSGLGLSSPQARAHVEEIEETSDCKESMVFKKNSVNHEHKEVSSEMKDVAPEAVPQLKTTTSSPMLLNSNLTTDSSSPSVPDKPESSTIFSSLNFNLLSHFAESKSRLLGLQRNSQSNSPENSGDKKSGSDKGKLAKWQDREAFLFMRGIMDECTHLSNFEVPIDTSLIIAVCARDDAYVPREGCTDLADIWPGAEVRYLDAGHVSAYLLGQTAFRGAIVECFERLKKKYPSS